MEKKVDIVQYAQQTRQLYVRLLALVKWAASASKVDKCCVRIGERRGSEGLELTRVLERLCDLCWRF